METFLWSLLLAAISGLAYIAYRHPSGFVYLAYPLLWLTGTIVLGLSASSIFNLHFETNQLVEVVVEMDGGNSHLERLALNIKKYYDRLVAVCGIGFVVIFYLLFLLFLPTLISIREHKDKKKEDL